MYYKQEVLVTPLTLVWWVGPQISKYKISKGSAALTYVEKNAYLCDLDRAQVVQVSPKWLVPVTFILLCRQNLLYNTI